jgi:hypothetical protein
METSENHWRPLTAVVTAAAASLAMSGCSTEKPDIAAFCVATSPGNVQAQTIEQTIQNTTLRLGVSRDEYRNFTFRSKPDMLGPKVVSKDENGNEVVTREQFTGTVVDAIKLKLIKNRKTDPEEWRNVTPLPVDEFVFCYSMKNANNYGEGGEIMAFAPPQGVTPAFDTTARNDISGGPSNYRKLLEKHPKGVFILDPSYMDVYRTIEP